MNKCYFCYRFLEENGYCNYCNILHCDRHFRINFLLIENSINIEYYIRNFNITSNNIRYYYDTQMCYVYLNGRHIKFEIKPNLPLEIFKKIVEKHLKYNHLK